MDNTRKSVIENSRNVWKTVGKTLGKLYRSNVWTTCLENSRKHVRTTVGNTLGKQEERSLGQH